MARKKDPNAVMQTDPSYVPEHIDDICFEYIANFCKAKGADDKAWLKNVGSSMVFSEAKQKETRISFIGIRKAFVQKYFPNLAPQAKEKKPTMYDIIDSL